jgi:hypothetical protein
MVPKAEATAYSSRMDSITRDPIQLRIAEPGRDLHAGAVMTSAPVEIKTYGYVEPTGTEYRAS